MKNVNFRHSGIIVTNIDRALKFYRDLLGLKPLVDFTEKGAFIEELTGLTNVELRMVKLETRDNKMIELLQYKSPRLSKKIAANFSRYAHTAFTVENLTKCYKCLKKAGIKFVSKPLISPDKFAKVVYCFDPDKNIIELVEILKKKGN